MIVKNKQIIAHNISVEPAKRNLRDLYFIAINMDCQFSFIIECKIHYLWKKHTTFKRETCLMFVNYRSANPKLKIDSRGQPSTNR